MAAPAQAERARRNADLLGHHAVACANCGRVTVTAKDPGGQPRTCSACLEA